MRPFPPRPARSVAPLAVPSAAVAARGQKAQRGVALVITLILLALITTLTVAFLALTHRETGAVDAMSKTIDAELLVDSALNRGEAQIVSAFRVVNLTNNGAEIMGPDLTVSRAWDTNRLNPVNMVYDPSPPVFVDTNRGGTTGPLEDRFYLDLNRSGTFEESGYVEVTDNTYSPISGLTNYVVGDPLWVGLLQDPRRPHSPTNRFVGRYAFLIQPIGRSLDLNWIHNQALGTAVGNDMRAGGNGFYRNQGIGPWEINLAGFLNGLNTNSWGNYAYEPLNPVVSGIANGFAFDDARELLRYRYTPPDWDVAAPPQSPDTRNDTFNALAPALAAWLIGSHVDAYADGPLGPLLPFESLPSTTPDNTARPWPGADSRRHYFTLHDYFDQRKLPEAPPGGFRYRLAVDSATGNSYDRYTYYRMLSQLGTDSVGEEDDDKININFVNIPSWLPPHRRYPPTNSWTRTDTAFVNLMGRPGPELFLLSLATNLLVREPELAFVVTNKVTRDGAFFPDVPLLMPIFTNGSSFTTNLPLPGPLYAGRFHQILQLAANLHDATTGPKNNERYPYFPNVFRPQFHHAGNGDVYITNYVLVRPEVESAGLIMTNRVWHDLDANDPPMRVQPNHNVYGIPLIVGARKGHPTFNEFAMFTSVEAVRRLIIGRATAGSDANFTNQTFVINMTNYVQVEARNPYAAAYPPITRQVDLYFGIRSKTVVTNSNFAYPWTNWVTGYSTSFTAQSWPGTTLGDLQYQVSPVLRQPILNTVQSGAPEPGGITNRWGLTITNRMLFFLVDHDTQRILDTVSLNGPRNFFDVATEMGSLVPGKSPISLLGNIWSNERDTASGASRGVANQILISQGREGVTPQEWNDYSDRTRSMSDAIAQFNDFVVTKKAGTNQVPFTPGRVMYQTNFFRVNDPLVHYTLEDLDYTGGRFTLLRRDTISEASSRLLLGTKNPNSIPWNNGSGSAAAGGIGALDASIRDPGVTSADAWDFPTNMFPNLGWIGRVHRGTPWQTVYLKSKVAGPDWNRHSGPARFAASSQAMVPIRDWNLLDVLTATPHTNAARGRLSINQTNLAAWSAVLAGVPLNSVVNDPDAGVLTSASPAAVRIAEPAGMSDAVGLIVAGINRTRGGRPNAQFAHLGQVLATPELSMHSPFLNTSAFNADTPNGTEQVFDSDYERIPQQILSLLKVGEPRFVIYSWGQSLKPARFNPEETGPAIVTTGPDRGLCRNYQITGEVATRAVVRVEFDIDPITGLRDYSQPHAVVESFNVLPVE